MPLHRHLPQKHLVVKLNGFLNVSSDQLNHFDQMSQFTFFILIFSGAVNNYMIVPTK